MGLLCMRQTHMPDTSEASVTIFLRINAFQSRRRGVSEGGDMYKNEANKSPAFTLVTKISSRALSLDVYLTRTVNECLVE